MSHLLRQFRGAGIALVVLTVSAGVAFAGAPRFQPVADEQPGTVEVTETTDGTETTETTDGTETTTTTDDEDGDEDGTTTTETGDGEAKTHGDWVSEAAHAPLPAGFTRGQYVSCVARADTAAEGYVYPTDPVADCGITPKAEKTKGPKAERGASKADAAKTKTHGKAKAGKGKPGS
ncbi:MAG TPA: hypothetical protein VFY23_01355 [Candidatus Limnocylindrales bacterium]|nr:hypothetical protein [Candidatus Limnocylindrales bacterium]